MRKESNNFEKKFLRWGRREKMNNIVKKKKRLQKCNESKQLIRNLYRKPKNIKKSGHKKFRLLIN